MKRLAVVLFNLGGPDSPKAVRPFLFNLFNDKAIIGLPALARTPLAALIAARREKEARANYAVMGGASPLLPETEAQAGALAAILAAQYAGAEVKVFIAMRYWRPFTDQAARKVAAWGPDEVVLLPLYPQFSTTTTGSSLNAWRRSYKGPGRVRSACCYPIAEGLVAAHARLIEAAWTAAGRPTPVRLLFSAHGLPENIIAGGDPYQAQVEATSAAIAARLGPGWDWTVSYQSRVGPLKWIGPSTPEALAQAAADGVGLVICPVAFVSEHVETLVELDRDYARLADDLGVPAYIRVPALGIEAAFIEGLAEAVDRTLSRSAAIGPASVFVCPVNWSQCPSRAAGATA